MTTTESGKNFQPTVLVTGACGFIGSHLCEHYLRKNFRVIGVDNFCTAYRMNLDFLQALPEAEKNFHFIESDVSKSWNFSKTISEDWKTSLKYVFHFASPASPPLYQKLALETMEVNTTGLKHALEFADQNNSRVIFASTSEIYGDPLMHPQKEDYWGNVNTLGPRSCYDESKRFGESLIYTWNLIHKTSHGLVRIFNTYGPGMNPTDGRVIVNFLNQAHKKEELTLYGDGNQTRSFCYISDLIEGITRYADLKNYIDVVNLGNPVEYTVNELAETVCRLFPGTKISPKKTPMPINDPVKRRPDITRAQQLMNWHTKVSLEEGLVKMYAWLENGN